MMKFYLCVHNSLEHLLSRGLRFQGLRFRGLCFRGLRFRGLRSVVCVFEVCVFETPKRESHVLQQRMVQYLEPRLGVRLNYITYVTYVFVS